MIYAYSNVTIESTVGCPCQWTLPIVSCNIIVTSTSTTPSKSLDVMNLPDPRSLKHRPVVLLSYAQHDGIYPAHQTDCQYISLGWAQYDPRQLSVKVLRHNGNRWSRQSEELPLHRCIDSTLLIAATVGKAKGSAELTLEEEVLERQSQSTTLVIETEGDSDRDEFERKLADPLLLRRLGKLADALIPLRSAGKI